MLMHWKVLYYEAKKTRRINKQKSYVVFQSTRWKEMSLDKLGTNEQFRELCYIGDLDLVKSFYLQEAPDINSQNKMNGWYFSSNKSRVPFVAWKLKSVQILKWFAKDCAALGCQKEPRPRCWVFAVGWCWSSRAKHSREACCRAVYKWRG